MTEKIYDNLVTIIDKINTIHLLDDIKLTTTKPLLEEIKEGKELKIYFKFKPKSPYNCDNVNIIEGSFTLSKWDLEDEITNGDFIKKLCWAITEIFAEMDRSKEIILKVLEG